MLTKEKSKALGKDLTHMETYIREQFWIKNWK